MPVPWLKRKARVQLREKRDKELGRLPYWNDRARSINYKAKRRYGCTDVVTGQQLKDIYEMAGGECIYCREPVTYSQAYFDHMNPLNAGGCNRADNLGISCCECNSSKGDDDTDTWLMRVENTRTPERLYNRLYAREEDAI